MDLKSLKLTEVEEKQLNEFVGKAVMKNAHFPLLGNRVGVSKNVNIQEIVNSNDSTIREMGKSINKLINDSDTEFSLDTKELSFNGIKAVDLKEALKLILKLNAYKSEVSKARRLKQELTSERNALKTPEERRQEIDAQLKAVETLELEEA